MAADGSIIVKAEVDDKQAQADLNRLTKKIDALNEKITSKKQEQMPLVTQAKELGAALDAAKAKLAEMQSGDSFYVAGSVKAQETEVKNLQKEWDNAQIRVEKMDASIQKDTANLGRMQAKAGDLAAQLAGAGDGANGLSEAAKRADEYMNKFLGRVKTLARRIFVFSLIAKALSSLKDYMWKAIKTNDEAVSAIARLKGALLTLAQPIINVIIPAFTALVNMLTRIVGAISRVVSGLFGTTAEQSAEAAESLYKEQKALDGVGSSAKKAGKSLASFDEINKLSGDSESSGGGASSSAIAPDFKQTIQGGLSSILELFAGAALLAVGAILTFSGANVLLGIALMALGAAFMWDAITSDSNLAAELVKSGLDQVLQVVGPLVALLGVILIIAGHWGIGIGLLIAGIALWSVGAAADDSGSFAENVKNRLMSALTLISPLIAVLGIVLIVTGHLLMGIAMLIAGIAIFAISAVSDQGNVTIEKATSSLGLLLSVIGPFLAILGVILLLFGQIPIGLGLLISGIALFGVGQAALNFEELKTNIVGALSNILQKVGEFLLIIGIILLFIPGMMGFGFGAMVGGIALVGISEIMPNWNAVLEKLQEAWAAIVNWWNTTVMGALTTAKETIAGFGSGIIARLKEVLGIASPSTETAEMGDYMMQGMANGITDSQYMVLDVFQAVLDSMQLSFQTWQTNFDTTFTKFNASFTSKWSKLWYSMNSVFTTRWNAILDSLQDGIDYAIRALNELIDDANSISILTGRRYNYLSSITVNKLPIPKLASGAVIPPNREFMAVLGDQKQGTNIETPLSTMVQAFRMALSEGGGQNEAVMEVDGEKFGKLIYRLNKSENSRVGVDLTEE